MSTNNPSLTEKLGAHLVRAVDTVMLDRARLHLLDWMACVGAARNSAIAAKLENERPMERAVWLGNLMEMDDVHRSAILHPGPVVWPTALMESSDGMRSVLEAAVRGYEATIAIGSTFDALHYHYYHNSAVAGGFGAAVTAASLQRANAEHYVAALGLAGSVAGGLWQMRHEANDAKQWHISHAVDTGRRAARLAMLGITGPRAILDGPQGLHDANCASARPLTLTANWKIAEVSFKPWGACRHAHPAIDAALELKRQGLLDGPVEISTYADAVSFCDRPTPTSVTEAKFSLQHAVAIVAERGEPSLRDFEPDSFEALAQARSRVTVREDATITSRYPDHFGASVSTAAGEVSVVDTLGDPERPMDTDAIITKARALLEWGGVSAEGIDAAISGALHGDNVQAVCGWIEDWA